MDSGTSVVKISPMPAVLAQKAADKRQGCVRVKISAYRIGTKLMLRVNERGGDDDGDARGEGANVLGIRRGGKDAGEEEGELGLAGGSVLDDGGNIIICHDDEVSHDFVPHLAGRFCTSCSLNKTDKWFAWVIAVLASSVSSLRPLDMLDMISSCDAWYFCLR